MVHIHSENLVFKLPKIQLIKKWIKTLINDAGFKVGEVNIIFCNDEYLLDLNINFLNHNYYTDIITFPYSEKYKIIGDLFISIDRAKENANLFKTQVNDELNRLIAHGVLHLIGYNDKTKNEKIKMTEMENSALTILNQMIILNVSRETIIK